MGMGGNGNVESHSRTSLVSMSTIVREVWEPLDHSLPTPLVST